MKSEKIATVVETAMKNLSSMIDVNTVMGTPVVAENGKIIIPVSKVTVAFMSGGGEYGKVKFFHKDDELPFAGGTGAVINLKPVGFLISDNSEYKIIQIDKEPFDKVFDFAENFINKTMENNK
ncbi:MAG: hypothetical protein J6V68_04240 [Clostridia bacterium]|nr:hypothetical protein [Clostridia bacterium]